MKRIAAAAALAAIAPRQLFSTEIPETAGVPYLSDPPFENVMPRSHYAWGALTFGNLSPTLIISNRKVWNKVSASILPRHRWTHKTRKQVHFMFDGADWTWDDRCPEDRIYFINEQSPIYTDNPFSGKKCQMSGWITTKRQTS